MDEQKKEELKKHKRTNIRDLEKTKDEFINSKYIADAKLKNIEKKIIDLIYRMRMMNTIDIQVALGYKSYSDVAKHLRRLYMLRFLERKQRPLEVRLTEKGQNRSNEMYYMLDLAGALFIYEYYDFYKQSEVKWEKREISTKYEFELHALKVSEVYARFENAIQERIEKFKIPKNQERIVDAVCDKHLYLKFTDTKAHYFAPDMFVKYMTDNKLYGYFFEVDRGTVAMQSISKKTSSFDKKVAFYEGFRENQKEYLGFSKMPKVIVITTSRSRAEQLKTAVVEKQRELGKNGVEFLFTVDILWEKNPFGKIFINNKDELVKTMMD